MIKSTLVNKIKHITVDSFEHVQGLVAAVAFNGGCNVNLDEISPNVYSLTDWDNLPMAVITVSK